MTAKWILVIIFVLSVDFFCCIKSEEEATGGDLEDFQKWFEDHGGRCRCRFMKKEDHKFTAVADRRIVEKESILMVPQSLLVNSATVERYCNTMFRNDELLYSYKNIVFLVQTKVR